MANHNDLGKKGEQLAIQLLLEKNYEIVARNYIYQKAEVDIIARKKDVLAVIEVKTRSSKGFGNPQEFLKRQQMERIIKAVDAFVIKNNLEVEVRFDIIAIVIKGEHYNIEHLENAFYHF